MHAHKRIARLMRVAGLVGASRRRTGVVTTRRDNEARPAPDLVEHDFAASKPNQLLGSRHHLRADGQRVPLPGRGFDACSRKIVGWSMANHLRAELVLAAMEMAINQRRPGDVIHHSDQGSQYTSLAFGKRCKEAGVRRGSARPGTSALDSRCRRRA